MKVMMMLCDSAGVTNGRLHIHGGGWQVANPVNLKHSLALMLYVPWARAGGPLPVRMELQDSAGRVAPMPNPSSWQQAVVSVEINLDRPTSYQMPFLSVPVVFDVPPITLKPQSRYTWRLFLDGETKPGWQMPFATA